MRYLPTAAAAAWTAVVLSQMTGPTHQPARAILERETIPVPISSSGPIRVETIAPASPDEGDTSPICMAAYERAVRQRALSERFCRTRGPIRDRDGKVLLVRGDRSICLNIGELHGIPNGLRFSVWCRGQQPDWEKVALVEVHDVGLRYCAAHVVKRCDPRPITKDMLVSNPFFDPKRELTVYVPPHVRVCAVGGAGAWIQACGSRSSRSLDDSPNVVVLAPNAGYPDYESDLREKARVIGALVVEEGDLLTYLRMVRG